MKRFLVFPLALGFVGAFFIATCALQGTLPMLPVISTFATPGRISIWEQLGDLFSGSWHYGLITSAISGFFLAIWDLIRNRRSTEASNRLPMNLFWCLCYSFIILFLNGVAIYVATLHYAQIKIKPPPIFLVWPFISAALFNFTAIFWAAIRSITTDDVLTPRVLLTKLRQRARLG